MSKANDDDGANAANFDYWRYRMVRDMSARTSSVHRVYYVGDHMARIEPDPVKLISSIPSHVVHQLHSILADLASGPDVEVITLEIYR